MKKNKKAQNTDRLFLENEAKLRLLISLPAFQKDVATLRRDTGIVPNAPKWKEFKFSSVNANNTQISFNENGLKTFLRKVDSKGEIRGKKNTTGGSLMSATLKGKKEKREEDTMIKIKIAALGKKYHLPGNFYSDPDRGSQGLHGENCLDLYVRENKIQPPTSKWVVEVEVNPSLFGSVYTKERTYLNSSMWVILKTFAPLKKSEWQEAKKGLEEAQKNSFSKETASLLKTRKRFERDLHIFEQLSNRGSRHPVKKKSYKKGSYLERAERAGQLPDENKRDMEHKHKDDVVVGYDDVTSREIARKLKITPDAVRKVRERIEKLAKELFGVDSIYGH